MSRTYMFSMVPSCMIIGELLTLLLYDARRPPRRFLVCNQKKIASEKDFWVQSLPESSNGFRYGSIERQAG